MVAGGEQRSGRQSRRLREHELIIGRLLAHGRANYQFRVQNAESYYLKLGTSKGERLLWGADLERALLTGETQPQLGERVGARRVGREAVAMRADGGVLYRTQWRVEVLPFFANRAQLARRLRDEQLDLRRELKAYPELKSAFVTLRAAEEIAAQRIRNPADREKFVALVKEAMAGSVINGAPLPSVQLRSSVRYSGTVPTASKKDGPSR